RNPGCQPRAGPCRVPCARGNTMWRPCSPALSVRLAGPARCERRNWPHAAALRGQAETALAWAQVPFGALLSISPAPPSLPQPRKGGPAAVGCRLPPPASRCKGAIAHHSACAPKGPVLPERLLRGHGVAVAAGRRAGVLQRRLAHDTQAFDGGLQ